MALAMLVIPVVDGIAKILSADHSPLFISWARYAVACLIVIPYALARYGTRFLPQRNRVAHLMRTVFLMAAMTLYFLAIARIPLATAISAFFIGPIVAALLAVVLLGETLTLRKTLALVLGFGGAMLILQPGSEVDSGIVLAMAAGLLFGLYLVATRKASPNSDAVKTLAFQCLVGTLILSPQAIYSWSIPATDLLPLFAMMGMLSAISHILSISAFRHAEASTLAPLVYLELVGSALFGYLVFDELPGPMVWAGAAVIVVGGLILVGRNRRPVGGRNPAP